jgi:hypothetical protein
MRSAIMMGGVALLMATSVQAATLNKCIDAYGQITYSNLPCRNAREARAVEIDPAPVPDPVKLPVAKPPPVRVAPVPRSDPTPVEPVATIKLNTKPAPVKLAKPASVGQCDSLTDKLGAVFDKMDEARRTGYTQEQMNKWKQEIEALETKKQQSGCF